MDGSRKIMILTICNTTKPAGNLGFLLHKHPDKLQTINLAVGRAHIFYPESSEDRTTVALMLEIDPIDMVRGGGRNLSGRGFSLGQYVNDRPYVVSSFMSVALSKAFSTAMNAKCNNRPELVDEKLALEVSIDVLPAPGGGEALIRKFFEPLGYRTSIEQNILDGNFLEWGMSKHFSVKISQQIRLCDLLNHLYVLIPALDNDKHYYVSQDEVDKLLARGENWLSSHPAKDQIVSRYLINLKSLSRQASSQLMQDIEAEKEEVLAPEPTEIRERKASLHQQRLDLALEKLKASNASSVVDMGCGEGKLLRMLIKQRQFTKIAGMDISYGELSKAKQRLHWDDMAPLQKERIQLFQGSLTYRDERLSGFDAAALVEVIEHLDEDRLQAFVRVVFEFARPATVVLSTPNIEYNALFENMVEGTLRHDDHRFEWTREQFEDWAANVCRSHNYEVEFFSVGEVHEEVGPPSQMGVFKRAD